MRVGFVIASSNCWVENPFERNIASGGRPLLSKMTTLPYKM